jgi:hypothetical protein
MTNTDRLAQALRSARAIVQEYAAKNPIWTHKGLGVQDPYGAHAALIEIDAAITSMAEAGHPVAWIDGNALSRLRNKSAPFDEVTAYPNQQHTSDVALYTAAQVVQCATAGNYVCDKEACPTSVRFADGRIVRLAHDADHGYYLEIERESRDREGATQTCR